MSFCNVLRSFLLDAKAQWRLKITTKKYSKISKFQQFPAIFVEISIGFVDSNVKNVQHEKNPLSSRLFRRDKCSLQLEMPKIDPKNDKTYKKFQFLAFLFKICQIFEIFWKLEC